MAALSVGRAGTKIEQWVGLESAGTLAETLVEVSAERTTVEAADKLPTVESAEGVLGKAETLTHMAEQADMKTEEMICMKVDMRAETKVERLVQMGRSRR